jgi:hypothetical protein
MNGDLFNCKFLILSTDLLHSLCKRLRTSEQSPLHQMHVPSNDWEAYRPINAISNISYEWIFSTFDQQFH